MRAHVFPGCIWWCIYTSVCLNGSDRKYIRAKKTDVFFLSKFTLSVSFTLMYFLSAPTSRQRCKCTITVHFICKYHRHCGCKIHTRPHLEILKLTTWQNFRSCFVNYSHKRSLSWKWKNCVMSITVYENLYFKHI